MHIWELSRTIAEFLLVAEPRGLAALARVARFVSAVSLDILWRYLPSTLPVISLLPSIIMVDGQYTLAREVHESEWTTFDKYSSRICHFANIFSSSLIGSSTIDCAIFKHLQQMKGGPLFPQLKTISIHLPLSLEGSRDYSSYTSDLASFMQPSLLRVQIIGPSLTLSGLIRSCLVLLAQASPHVEHLRIQAPINLGILKVIPGFLNLKICDFDFHDMIAVPRFQPSPAKKLTEIYTEMTRTLSTMTTLTTLLLSLPVTVGPTVPIQFHALKCLAIKTTACAKFGALLPLMPHLKHLIVCIPLLVPQECEVLGSHLPPSLRHLQLRSFKGEECTHTLSILQPFMKLELESLIVESCILREVVLSDFIISKIATAWPKIRILHLFSSGCSTKQLSPNAILHLARACPSLVDLSLGHADWQRPVAPIVPFEQTLGPNFYLA